MPKGKKSTQEKKKLRPVKNYVIYGLIVVVTVVLVIYLAKCYQEYQAYQEKIPVIRGTVREVKEEELKPYLLENEEAFIYMCTAAKKECRDFEKDLKQLVEKEGLKEDFIYVNLDEVSDVNAFFKSFNETYSYKTKLGNYPALIYYKDGKIEKMLQQSDKSHLTIDQVNQILDVYEIGIEE